MTVATLHKADSAKMLQGGLVAMLLLNVVEIASGTVLPEPTRHRFELRDDGGKLCFLFQGGLYVQVVYPTGDGTTHNLANIDVGRGNGIEVTGKCDRKNLKALPTITFTHGQNTRVDITFDQSVEKDGIVTLQHESVSVSLAKTDFPDMAGDDVREIKGSNFIHYKLSRPDEFWGCKDTFTDPVSQDISLRFGEEQVQSFGIKEDLSDHGVWCTLPTPVSASNPVMTYTVTKDNEYCVVLRGGLQLTIPYRTDMDRVISKTAGIPDDSITDTYSFCTHKEQYLRLNFYNQWMLAFHFAKDDSSFFVTQIDLTYYVNDMDFPNFKLGTGGLLNVEANVQNTFKANIGGSYRCSAGESLTLNNGIILNTNNFQVKAFSVDTSSDFLKEGVTDCHADRLARKEEL